MEMMRMYQTIHVDHEVLALGPARLKTLPTFIVVATSFYNLTAIVSACVFLPKISETL